MANPSPLRLRIPRIQITFWRVVLAIVMVIGAYASYVRFFKGLGASSGLSDEMPWGLWIGFDVLCGVALAAGGFTVAGVVYVLRLKAYHSILRPTVLTAFLGYMLVGVSLMYDLGRPWRIWHPMIMWNEHSVMFEVAWCVMLYLTVLALEFSPVVLERFKGKHPVIGKAAKTIHTLTPLIVIAGVVLSTLHQSSLGTVFVIAPNKLHPLWYTPFLPVLFWCSAIAVGLAMTIFESALSHRGFGVAIHNHILQKLGKAISVVLFVYLIMKVGTLVARGNLHYIFERSTESYLFILEMLMGVIAPMILFLFKRIRENRKALFYSATLVVLGVVLNRLNVSITGIQRYTGNTYFPTFLEAMSSVFLIACGLLAFALISRYFAVFEPTEESHEPRALEEVPAATLKTRQSMVSLKGVAVLVSLVVVFAGLAAWSHFVDKTAQPRATDPQVIATGRRKLQFKEPPKLNLPADYVFPKAGNSPGAVVFSHQRHVRMNANACTNCHPKPYRMSSIDIPTIECEYGKMSGCGHCHDGSASFDIQHGCKLCHSRTNQEAVAQNEEQMPWRLADVQMAVFDRSMGTVFFSHSNHVKNKKLACNECHPSQYRMKHTERAELGADRQAFIDWGHKCKSCHNGMRAFAQDNCAKCHTRWTKDAVAADPERPRQPTQPPQPAPAAQ